LKIMLLTRCGCSQWREISEKTPPPLYHVVLNLPPVSVSEEFDPTETMRIERRTFTYRDTSRYGNFHVYLEKP
jgi:hypothetical protein